jgi:gamma-butyrobetaine dioxygenase
MKIANVSHAQDRLRVSWAGGHHSEYHSLWLLDNSPEHRDEHNGQRRIDILDLPEDPEISDVAFGDEWIEVTWAALGKSARFPVQWLEDRCNCNAHIFPPIAPRPELTLWRTEDAGRFCEMEYREFCGSASARARWLRAAASWGIAFLRGVLCEEREILLVASFVGWLRETNYGRVFNVAVNPRPNNLAYTNTALGLHTDNPYREPVPGLQILHCLKSADGGESLFVDGFAVAETLRQMDADAFDQITRTKVEFRFQDASTELSTCRPLIQLHEDGSIAAVHYNSRSIAPLKLPADSVAVFYRAYRRFALLLSDPRFQVRMHLNAGDLVLFDNHRVLHGRTAFSSSEPRRLQGVYLDHDGLLSNLAALERTLGIRYVSR